MTTSGDFQNIEPCTDEDEWIAAREAEIKELEPQLLCRVLVADPPLGHEPPCNALTPEMVRAMLYSRTGIRGWRVRLFIDLNVLEILPPLLEKIGELTVERDFLARGLARPR